MSTSKLNLNPYETEFIPLAFKRQRDRFKACFPIPSLSKHVQSVFKKLFYATLELQVGQAVCYSMMFLYL